MVCRVVGGARAVAGQAECLTDQMLGDVLGVECGVTAEEQCSLFFIMTT